MDGLSLLNVVLTFGIGLFMILVMLALVAGVLGIGYRTLNGTKNNNNSK